MRERACSPAEQTEGDDVKTFLEALQEKEAHLLDLIDLGDRFPLLTTERDRDELQSMLLSVRITIGRLTAGEEAKS